jgi:dolichol-phosphate mannosyltransferase
VEPEALYRNRFSRSQERDKARVWKILVEDYFQQYARPNDTVLDLGCGYGEFLNNVVAARRIGIDANAGVKARLATEIEFHTRDVTDLEFLQDSSVDVVFASNLLEHLPNKPAVEKLIGEIHRVLRNGGRLILMGPNARLVPGAYWDYWDHHVALTERSLAEVLAPAGFAIDQCLAGFLPYSTQSRLPQWSILVRAYLKSPFFWSLFGRQFLNVARKR